MEILRKLPCVSFQKMRLIIFGGETSKFFLYIFYSIPYLGRINIQFEQKRVGEKNW